MGVGEDIARLMARQNGVIGRAQAVALGATPAFVRTRIDRGDWLPLEKGIYAGSSTPDTWERGLRAAVLSHQPGLVAGRSAAFLHGFDGVRKTRHEILVPYGANSRSQHCRLIRARHFGQVATVSVRGFVTTSVAETVLTLSLTHPAQLIERFVDDRLAARKLAIPEFSPILDRLQFARQPGLKALRSIVAARAHDAYQPPANELERLLYGLLDHDEVPPYRRQLPMSYEWVDATVDAYVDEWELIVEGDGRRWHNRQADHDRDRLRDAEALAAGFVVLRLTWEMLRHRPDECLRRLLAIGRARSRPSVRT